MSYLHYKRNTKAVTSKISYSKPAHWGVSLCSRWKASELMANTFYVKSVVLTTLPQINKHRFVFYVEAQRWQVECMCMQEEGAWIVEVLSEKVSAVLPTHTTQQANAYQWDTSPSSAKTLHNPVLGEATALQAPLRHLAHKCRHDTRTGDNFLTHSSSSFSYAPGSYMQELLCGERKFSLNVSFGQQVSLTMLTCS